MIDEQIVHPHLDLVYDQIFTQTWCEVTYKVRHHTDRQLMEPLLAQVWDQVCRGTVNQLRGNHVHD